VRIFNVLKAIQISDVSCAPTEHTLMPFRFEFCRLFLLKRAFRMSLLDFADILLKLTFELRSVCFESRVVRAQKKINMTVVFDYFQEIVGAE
jgi:hypothetical protein